MPEIDAQTIEYSIASAAQEFDATVYGFEAYPPFYDRIKERFKDLDNVHIFDDCFAVGAVSCDGGGS